MRTYRRYALGAALVALAIAGAACGSGGSGAPGVNVLNYSPAADQNVFVVTKATATQFGLSKVSDLAKVASQFVFGAPPDCPTNPFCQIGLKNVYGIEFKEVKKLDFGGPLTVNGLKSGAIQVGELFSTSVYDPDFVVLDDDKHLEAADNLVPLVRKAVDSAEIDTILNAVMAKLTTDNVLAMNKQYDVDKKDAASIAQAFIQQNGLSASPGTGSGKSLTVGVSANFNEQVILAEMFKILLQQAGYTVKTEENLESRKVSDPALFSGKIDIKVEYLASESIQNDPNAKVNGDPANNQVILRQLLANKTTSS